MSKNKIEWTSEVWNPTTGCNPVSEGCKFCYAKTMSARLKGMGKIMT
jgi:protein gp37